MVSAGGDSLRTMTQRKYEFRPRPTKEYNMTPTKREESRNILDSAAANIEGVLRP